MNEKKIINIFKRYFSKKDSNTITNNILNAFNPNDTINSLKNYVNNLIDDVKESINNITFDSLNFHNSNNIRNVDINANEINLSKNVGDNTTKRIQLTQYGNDYSDPEIIVETDKDLNYGNHSRIHTTIIPNNIILYDNTNNDRPTVSINSSTIKFYKYASFSSAGNLMTKLEGGMLTLQNSEENSLIHLCTDQINFPKTNVIISMNGISYERIIPVNNGTTKFNISFVALNDLLTAMQTMSIQEDETYKTYDERTKDPNDPYYVMTDEEINKIINKHKEEQINK